MRPSPANSKAFTLIEVMLAATVLLVGLSGMIFSIGMGAEMLDTAHKTQIAQQIIDGEINRMRVAEWGTGVGGKPGTVSYPTDATNSAITIDQSGVASGDEAMFRVTNFSTIDTDDNKPLLNLAKGYTVTLTVSTPRTDYRIFSYTVQWSSALGKTHSRNGVTYIANCGLSASYKR